MRPQRRNQPEQFQHARVELVGDVPEAIRQPVVGLNTETGQAGGAQPSKLTNAVLGGRRMAWILTLQGGQPLTIGCTRTTAAGLGCNALVVPGQSVDGGLHNVNQWLNPAAFNNPPDVSTTGQTDLAPLGGAPTQAIGPGFHRLIGCYSRNSAHRNGHSWSFGGIFQPDEPSEFCPAGIAQFYGTGILCKDRCYSR